MVCHDGDNKDACLCDKSFAEKLASINQQCSADQADGKTDSPFCINEDFRTENGGGAFDPFDETEGIDIFIAYFPPCSFQSIRTSQIPTRSSVKSHSNNYWSEL